MIGDILIALPAIPGFKGVVFGLVYGAIRGGTLNPVSALKKIGWVDYLAGYGSGFLGGFIIWGLDH